MEHLPIVSLTKDELATYDHFEVEDFEYTFQDGKKISHQGALDLAS